MKDIVILSGSTPWSVLSLSKCAYKHNVRSFVICIKNGWGRKYGKSKLVFRAYDVYENDIDNFWKQFFEENYFIEKPILYVTSDYVCKIVESDRAYYEQMFTVCMASSYIINSFIDKSIAVIEASRHGLLVPKTIEIHGLNDLKNISSILHFPVIVKPVNYIEHNSAKFKFKICINEQDLYDFIYPYIEKDIHIQCQQYIPGEDSEYVFYQFYRDENGMITECMGEKTLQVDGIMAVGTTKYDDELRHICQRFLKKIDYVGIGGIEFKKLNGKYFFIEMSTRTEGFLPISDMGGVSLEEASYLSLNRIAFDIPKQKDEIQYVLLKSCLVDMKRRKGIFFTFLFFLRMFFLPKANFIEMFLDKWWVMKLYLKLLN